MKFFHIDHGMIDPGVKVNHELHKPSLVFDGMLLRLSEYYFKSGSNPNRVLAADLEVEDHGGYVLDPESDSTSSEALVFLETKQTTAALHLTIDCILGSEQVLYCKRSVQAGIELLGNYVEFSTTCAMIRLLPGQELTVHAVFTKRKKLPFPRSIKEVISRWREGPQYEFDERIEESYTFDGISIKSTK